MSKFSFCRVCLDMRQFLDKTPMSKNSCFECDICGSEI